MNHKNIVDIFNTKLYNEFRLNRLEVKKHMKFDREQVDIALAQSDLASYSQLARRMGCSAQNLSVILNRGSCKPVTAGKIAQALGVPVDSIIKKEVNRA